MSAKPGEFVRSLRGRDQGSIYVVLDQSDSALSLADGKYHSVRKPKKKNQKHIQMVHYSDNALTEKIISNTVKDEDIKFSLKQYGKDQSK